MHDAQMVELPKNEELADYIRAYIGPNAHRYEKFIQAQTNENPPKYKAGWCWGAFFLFIGWPMFRKQWKLAAIMFGINIAARLLGSIVPLAFVVLSFAAVTAMAIFGKNHYVRNAKHNVKLILQENPNHEDAMEQIRKRGGVSWFWGFIGAAPMIAAAIIITITFITFGTPIE